MFQNGLRDQDHQRDHREHRSRGEGAGRVQVVEQQLDMQRAALTTTFDYADKATISYTYYALRHLPHTVLLDVSITAKKDVALTAASVMEAPDVPTPRPGAGCPVTCGSS